MGKYKAKEIKDLSDFVREKRKKDRIQTLQEAKSVTEKIMKVREFIMGPKQKPAERTAIYDPKSKELLTDEKEILYPKPRYNVGVLTKNSVQPIYLKDVQDKNEIHEQIMNSTESIHTEPLSGNTYRDVLRHLKKWSATSQKLTWTFQDTIFDNMSDFMFHKMGPDKYDHT